MIAGSEKKPGFVIPPSGQDAGNQENLTLDPLQRSQSFLTACFETAPESLGTGPHAMDEAPAPAGSGQPRAPERDLDDGPISSTSSVVSGSDTASVHSASLPWIRTGWPSRRGEQPRVSGVAGKVPQGRPCPPLHACSVLQTLAQGEEAHVGQPLRPESPEYAQSPCGDTLMPLSSVSTGTQHQDRRGRVCLCWTLCLNLH
jgi:hypothetical protein